MKYIYIVSIKQSYLGEITIPNSYYIVLSDPQMEAHLIFTCEVMSRQWCTRKRYAQRHFNGTCSSTCITPEVLRRVHELEKQAFVGLCVYTKTAIMSRIVRVCIKIRFVLISTLHGDLGKPLYAYINDRSMIYLSTLYTQSISHACTHTQHPIFPMYGDFWGNSTFIHDLSIFLST